MTARGPILVLSVTALAAGVVGLLLARDLGFAAGRGEVVFGLGVSFNPLGALFTSGLALLAIAGALLDRLWLVSVAALGFALGAVQVLVQFGRSPNWLGTRGSNLSMYLALAVGLWSLVWLERRSG